MKPTVDDFFRNNKDLRLAMLASLVTYHVIDYVAQNRASNPTDGDKQAGALRAKAKDKFCFNVVEAFALASKHCTLIRNKPGFSSGDYMVAHPSFANEMVAGATFLNDPIGGIPVQWEERCNVNLTTALEKTDLKSEFPELTEMPSSEDPESAAPPSGHSGPALPRIAEWR